MCIHVDQKKLCLMVPIGIDKIVLKKSNTTLLPAPLTPLMIINGPPLMYLWCDLTDLLHLNIYFHGSGMERRQN